MEMDLGVRTVRVESEVTTQEAADCLRISRPSLIQLLDEGKIAFRRVGGHRKVGLAGLAAFWQKQAAARRKTLKYWRPTTRRSGSKRLESGTRNGLRAIDGG